MGSPRVGHDWALHFYFSLSCIGEGHGNPLQCSCLESPGDGRARWAAVSGIAQSQTRLKWLSSLPFWGFFVSFMVFFAMWKLLIRSNLFIFVCIVITLGGGSEKDLAVIYVRECSSCFSSKNFILSSLTFRSLIHFEFIFVYGIRECSNFILLHVTVQFSQHHLLKRLSVPLYILVPLS